MVVYFRDENLYDGCVVARTIDFYGDMLYIDEEIMVKASEVRMIKYNKEVGK